mgnify:CR=1 FL=1
MHIGTRLGAAGLAAALLLPTGALAAGPDQTQARQEDLDTLYAALQEHHPDLYANTPQEAFEAKKAEIEGRLAEESDVDFALDLQSLVALIGDSHTTTNIGSVLNSTGLYPFGAEWYDGSWVLTGAEEEDAALLGQTVTALNGVPMDEICTRFGTLVSADNPVKLRRQTEQLLYSEACLDYLGIAESGEPLEVTTSGGSFTVEALPMEDFGDAALSSLSQQRESTPATAYRKGTYYFAQSLDDTTYYIQFNQCMEDPKQPMDGFAAQVEAELEAGDYRQVLLDLRNNGGGSDGVLVPILMLVPGLVEEGVKVYGLVGEATYSSAIINAVELVDAGGVLAGSPTSGSVNHFGSTGSFTLSNSGIRVSCSSKYIDLGTLLDADAGRGVESLEPDIAVPQTMADTLAGRDTAVEWLLAHPETLEQREYPDAPLTRGRFVGLLYAAAGSPAAAAEAGFQDLLSIEWFLPAVNWAAETGVTGGTAEGAFAAARHLTWQEAAVFLVRTAEALGLEPEAVRTAPLPDALAEGAWDQTALELAWEWGLLPEYAGSAAEIARVQGGAMADAFAALL